MPKLIKNAPKHPRCIAARFTLAEEKRVQEAADARGMSPAGFAREVVLSAIQALSTETIILEKLCETEFLLRQFFGGLFSQLSDKNSVMTHERFMKALSVAPGEGRRLAAELLSRKLQEGEKSDQQSA